MAALIERFLEVPRVASIRAVLDTYGNAAGGLLANGLAFSALFATVPIALVTVGLAGLVASDSEIQLAVAGALSQLLPPLRELIEPTLAALVDGSALTSVIGIVATIWTVSQFYVTLDTAISRIFGSEPERDVLRRNLRGLIWVALLLGTVVVLIVGASLSSALGAILPDTMPAARVVAQVLGSPVTLFAATIGVVVLVYRTVPPRPPRWAAIGLPGVVAGVAIVLVSQLFVFVAPRLVGFAAIVGSLATVFVALVWLSWTFQLLLYGASWVRVRDDRLAAVESAGAVPSAGLGGPAAATEPRRRGE